VRAAQDRDGGVALKALAAVDPWHCDTYESGLEQEPADAFAVLVNQQPRPAAGDCHGGASFMITRTKPELITPVTNQRILKVCEGGWQQLRATDIWAVWRCDRLRKGTVDGQTVARILEDDRLTPGIRWTDRHLAQVAKTAAN
jgi:hypothetical protein